MTHPRLEPVVEFDDMWMLHALKHLKLVIDHLLISAHVFLEDDFDSNLAIRAGGFSHNSIGSGTQRLSKVVSGPVRHRVRRHFRTKEDLLGRKAWNRA